MPYGRVLGRVRANIHPMGTEGIVSRRRETVQALVTQAQARDHPQMVATQMVTTIPRWSWA